MNSDRSLEKITNSDLRRLAQIARSDRKDFFKRKKRWSDLYSKRIICVALCQGAALHFIDRKNGVKDFDVWTFYSEHSQFPFPYRRRARADFGESKFGRWPTDPEKFKGRRVDLIGRSIQSSIKINPIEALRRYLSDGKTESAKKLAKKAVILLEPAYMCGKVIWPTKKNN